MGFQSKTVYLRFVSIIILTLLHFFQALLQILKANILDFAFPKSQTFEIDEYWQVNSLSVNDLFIWGADGWKQGEETGIEISAVFM